MSSNHQKGIDIANPIDINNGGDFGNDENTSNKDGIKNSTIILVVFTLALVVLFGRSFYLQFIKGSYFKDIAENNRIRELVIRAPRGLIKDREGIVLAQNVASFDVVFVSAHLSKDRAERERATRVLASIIEVNVQEIDDLFDKVEVDDRNSYLVKEHIISDKALEIIERTSELPGIYIGNSARRDYVDGDKFSHIIGYDGKVTKEELEGNPNYIMTDYIGKNGIEYSYEKFLHGKHGARRFEVDSNNNIKEDLGVINPKPGDTLILHIDAELQRHVSNVLQETLNENEDATGAVVVAIDPRNGGVRALVSLPSYDNNLFSGGIETDEYTKYINDQSRPLLNRAIAGEYPPGSTFKPFVASVALQEGVITEHTTVNCNGAIHVGAWDFPDWKTHGVTDVKKAIAESCDVFFYSVGGGWGNISGLGINRINQYSSSFGLGVFLGIDLPGEEDGNIPDNNWKFKQLGEKWYIGDSYHAAIGQGYITVTPLQIANVISIVANGGSFYRPHVVDKIISIDNKEQSIETEIVEKSLVNKENIQIVREGMRRTVTGPGGSGMRLNSLKVESAGKTGTAQFGSEEKTHAWYVSFAPYEEPELAMVVLFEGGGEGHDWAVPATFEIFKWYFDQERGTIHEEQEEGYSDEESDSTGNNE